MRHYGLFVSAIILFGSGSAAVASEIVYHPVNPTFGGNPLNGTPLLSQAQAQGEGAKSGAQSPDLSGLSSALSNLGSTVVVTPPASGSGSSSGGTSTSNAVRATVP